MSDWIEWKGGECPVSPETNVSVCLRVGGSALSGIRAGVLLWHHRFGAGDIIAYRVVDEKMDAAKAAVQRIQDRADAIGNTDANGEGKQTNPKDLVGSRKVPLSTLPWRVLWNVGLAMLEGMAKYGRHNYRYAGVRGSVYFDGLMRHVGAWWEGEDIDPDSGFHHIDKAIADLMVLRDSMLEGNYVDDRPPRGKSDFVHLNAEAARIVDLHKDKTPRHFTIADSKEAA